MAASIRNFERNNPDIIPRHPRYLEQGEWVPEVEPRPRFTRYLDNGQTVYIPAPKKMVKEFWLKDLAQTKKRKFQPDEQQPKRMSDYILKNHQNLSKINDENPKKRRQIIPTNMISPANTNLDLADRNFLKQYGLKETSIEPVVNEQNKQFKTNNTISPVIDLEVSILFRIFITKYYSIAAQYEKFRETTIKIPNIYKYFSGGTEKGQINPRRNETGFSLSRTSRKGKRMPTKSSRTL